MNIMSKKTFYEALLHSLKDREDYELCAKIRDLLKDLKDPDEIIVLELDKNEKWKN